jgi:hypothetical protein
VEFFLPACAKCRDTASRSAGKDTSSAARSNAEMFSSSASGNTKLITACLALFLFKQGSRNAFNNQRQGLQVQIPVPQAV